MIEPGGIYQFTGNLEQLEKDVSALRSNAIGIRNGGLHVHSRFQMLEAHYKAPEADQLLASTLPVSQKADAFATDLEAVADALDTYAYEVRPLVKRLAQLKADALAFVDSVEGKDDWTEDEDKVDRHQKLLDGVNSAVTAFQEAERRAASKISALVGGPKFVVDDGSHTQNRKEVMYGYGLDVLGQAKELPWGSPVAQTYDALDIGHHLKSFFWDGIVVDNIVAGVQGLGRLVGIGGSASDAWSQLGDIAGGVGQYTAAPYEALMELALGEAPEDPDVTRQKEAAREFGKALVAWDMWGENPTRASATVAFNALTFGAGPLAIAAKGGKAGTAAKTAATAAKVGEYIEPLSAAFKIGGKTASSLPKMSEVTAKIQAAFETSAPQRLHSDLELNGARVRIQDGEFIRVDADGNPIKDTPKRELGAHERAGQHDGASERELAGVGASSHRSGATAAHSENPTPRASHTAPPTDPRDGHAIPPSDHGASSTHGAHTSESAGNHGSDGQPADSQQAPPSSNRGEYDAATSSKELHEPENSIDQRAIDDRIRELDDREGGEGHAPGRHLRPDDSTLQDRLGSPKTDTDGQLKFYGPQSNYPGHVKSENNIDPLTGTTVDGVSGRSHRVGAYSTRFDKPRDMVDADAYFRKYIKDHGEPPENAVPIAEVLGPDAHKRLTGYYRDPEAPDEFLPVDFENGTIQAVYRRHGEEWHLHTMYPNPGRGRHP
ncbi:hypothetical protein ABT112_02760 [Streptomyces sp. NPDC002055]|uniref:hypothetical protein n=1 Tax=Streptomyces sp. NPDC002055 TaxID=3154534 RepID=UPI00332E9E07